MICQRLIAKLCEMLDNNILSPEQERIYGWINDELRLPVYADVFGGAAVLLNQKPSGYVTFVAHAGREIMNGLARTVRGDERNQVQYVNLLNEIAPVWNDQWGASTGFSNSEVPSHHEISRDICVMLKSLIDEHRQGLVRNEETNEVFFSTFLDYRDKDNIPKNFMREWKDARQWFLKHAHAREGVFCPDVESEIVKHFETLETYLLAAADSQYERIRGINEILDETNG